MIRLASLHKNSFTLLETILSITLLLIVIGGFANSSFYDNSDKTYMTLEKVENTFTSKDYTNLSTTKTKITIIKNENTNIIQNVNTIKYEDSNIKIFKYEL